MENHQLQLVDNTYNVEEAKEILFSLLNDKMKFLKLRLLNTMELYGSCSPDLESRLEHLKVEKELLYDIFKQYEGNDSIRLEVDCIVDIKVRKAQETSE